MRCQNRKGPVAGALLIAGDAPYLAMPVMAFVPAWAKGHFRAVIVIVVATITRIVVAATIVRARGAYADAYPAGAGVKANLRHCRRGGEDGRGCNKAKRNLFHVGSPLGTWIGKRLRRSSVPRLRHFGRRFRAKNIEQILRNRGTSRVRAPRRRRCFVHSAAMRKSCGASSCSGFLPLSQDWKRSR